MRVLSVFLRLFGKPASPWYPSFLEKYFRILKEVFADDCELMIVVKEGRAVSGVMSFYFRDEVSPYYGGEPAKRGIWRATISCTGSLCGVPVKEVIKSLISGAVNITPGLSISRGIGDLSRNRFTTNTSYTGPGRCPTIIRLIPNISFSSRLGKNSLFRLPISSVLT